ncbi:hypothetical protein GUJ93_ZPchr0004g39102 [Zizania palustris]|uniref:Uncharacterized protein n=1 Tax=Zizania palustris TaxID=103762 RepID=A0A8J5T0B5_ZIZPA|nr:hypothetical protein GUJ93_ZPchr0004g39102 [Zizania palustris]
MPELLPAPLVPPPAPVVASSSPALLALAFAPNAVGLVVASHFAFGLASCPTSRFSPPPPAPKRRWPGLLLPIAAFGAAFISQCRRPCLLLLAPSALSLALSTAGPTSSPVFCSQALPAPPPPAPKRHRPCLLLLAASSQPHTPARAAHHSPSVIDMGLSSCSIEKVLKL